MESPPAVLVRSPDPAWRDEGESTEARAALAEALHVDGHHAAAARWWERLAEEGYRPTESRLKAAVAHLAQGQEARGLAWLEAAREAGLEAAEILYVEGQLAWRNGHLDRAEAAFQQAMEADPRRSTAANALGVLQARRGHREEARHCLRLALERDPEDAEALVNLASLELETLGGSDRAGEDIPAAVAEEAERLLERAARLGPHRPEPYVLASRLFRHRGEAERAREALIRGRLRRRGRSPEGMENECGPPGLFSPSKEVGEVEGVLTLEGEGDFALTLTYRRQLTAEPPPWLAVNPGYRSIAVHGAPRRFAEDPAAPPEPQPGLLPEVRLVELAEDDWRTEEGEAVLRITLRGRPVPPCVAFRAGSLECAEPSAWLPLPLSRPPHGGWLWRLTLAGEEAERWLPHLSPAVGEEDGLALLALARESCHEATVDADAFGWSGPVRAAGPLDPGKLRFAAYLAARTGALWHALAGPRREPCPPLLVVDEPESDFCYTRPGFLRLASGILDRSGKVSKVSQLCHEVGHLWWGVDVSFPARDAWLGECLAEYTLHLAEDAGLVPGYRARVLERVFGDPALEPLADLGLRELARRAAVLETPARRSPQGWAAAAVLRYKGGFVVSMLRQILGGKAFAALLRCLHRLGHRHRIDLYTFTALAGRFHGHTLNGFFNQWLDASATLTLALRTEQTSEEAGGTPGLCIDAVGTATPGTPVVVAVETAEGTVEPLAASVELGRCRLPLPAGARRAVLDPQHRWFARTPTGRELVFEPGEKT